MEPIILKCPNCQEFISIDKNEINCHIFRHGVYKTTFKQIEPHSSKLDCDYLFNNKLIYGCSKPFMLVLEKDTYIAKTCDYI